MTALILLVTENPERVTLRRMLEPLGVNVRDCAGGSAMATALQLVPSLVLIRERGEPSVALQLCRSLRSLDETSSLPVIVSIDSSYAVSRLRILESGADECWASPIDSREFLLRLKAVTRRFENHQPRRILRYADLELDLDRYKVRRDGRLIDLAPIQFKLLRHLMENPTVVFSRQQLLEEVWNGQQVDDGAVTAGVVRLRRSLNAGGGENLIKNVFTAGYVLDAET